ncbi:unnamed protein product [Paramecium primaurelia]|uniref:Uncharacterized protein n=1 Tax=Paramecium primaurelia TaxID=5886 RepID=A0A8S1LLQ6_PARPR|nr:unnamed protein product [Paramecium primaurelia]
MNNAQFAQKLLKYEGRLYSRNLEMQMQTLQEVKQELNGQYNHQSLMNMLAKYFSYTSILVQRIKIIEIIQQKFPILVNHVQDWKQIVEFLQQECFSSDHQFRMLSLHALNSIVPVLKEQYNTFHIGIFDIFINASYQKELYIASLTLLNTVRLHHSYSFMNKIAQLPEIKIFKTKKLTILLKCTLMARAQFCLFEQPISELLAIVRQQIQSVPMSKEVLHLLYNYLKIASNFKDQEPFILKILTQEETINCIGLCSEKIQELFRLSYKHYKLEFKIVYLIYGDQYSKKNIIESLLQFDNLYNYTLNLSTEDLISFQDLLFYSYDFACNEIVKTVSVQTEQKLIQVLIKLDHLIGQLFEKQINLNKKPFSSSQKCLNKLLLLSVQLLSAQITFTEFKGTNSLTYIISLLIKNQNTYLMLQSIKLLLSINQVDQANYLASQIQSQNPYTQVFLSYLKSLQNYEEFTYWNDFQINSTQYLIRQEIYDYYQEFDKCLQEIQDIEIDQTIAMELFQKITNLLNKTTILSAKIEFFSNRAYAEDATFFQFIILDKINLCLQRNYLDLEIESLNYENSNLIIQKLIEYNKSFFIKKFLPNLRKDKLKEFIKQMRNSIYNYPKILLQLIQTPNLDIQCTQVEQQGSHTLLRFSAHLISKEKKTNCQLFLIYSINNYQEIQVEMIMKEQKSLLNIVVEGNSNIQYKLICKYQGILVLQTEIQNMNIICIQN